jgi:hypothetical protein
MTNQNNSDITKNLKNPVFWKRLLFMAVCAIAYVVAEFAIWAVILFLIFFNLFTGGSNERAVTLGRQISAYIYHLLLYLTYNTEERPFPFTDWPKPEKMPMEQTFTSGNAPGQTVNPAQTGPSLTPESEGQKPSGTE